MCFENGFFFKFPSLYAISSLYWIVTSKQQEYTPGRIKSTQKTQVTFTRYGFFHICSTRSSTSRADSKKKLFRANVTWAIAGNCGFVSDQAVLKDYV